MMDAAVAVLWKQRDSELLRKIVYRLLICFVAFTGTGLWAQAGLTFVNTGFDRSAPDTVRTKIIEKRHETKLRKHSYVVLVEQGRPRGPQQVMRLNDITGDPPKEGDIVEFVRRRGFLGIPWYSAPKLIRRQ